MQGGGTATRGNAHREVTQEPAGENERQMEVMRQRVHVERHQHDENGVTRGDASTSEANGRVA